MTVASVVLVQGDDPTLLAERVRALVDDRVGSGDRSLMVEELTEAGYAADGDYRVDPVVDASQTPPFLTEHRVVVARHLARFGNKEAVAPLVRYLGEPLDTTLLVLVWDKGPETQKAGSIPKSLKEAIQLAGGEVVSASVPRGRGAADWLADQIDGAGLRLDGSARKLLADHVGEHHGRVPAILAILTSVFGPGSQLDAGQIEPYLGEVGTVPPWELTDAIANGDVAAALVTLKRTLDGGARHPLQVMASLTTHYLRLARLDGSGARSDTEAAAILEMKGSTFPAKKALRETERLGRDRVHRCVQLLARADLDLRGASALNAETVMEVAVARLATQYRR